MGARIECVVAVDSCYYYILLYLLSFVAFISIYFYLLYLISLEAKNRNCDKDNSANSKGNTIPEGGNHQSKQVPQSHLVLL